MLIVSIPIHNYNKIQYIFKVLLEVWSDIKPVYKKHDSDCIEVTGNNGKIIFNSEMFSILKCRGLRKDDLFINEIEIDNIRTKILFKTYRPVIAIRENTYEVNADIIGSAFFLLTGFESSIHNPLDKHGRFEAKNSLISDITDNPVVHDYQRILISILRKIAPKMGEKSSNFSVIPTHDVDHPNEYKNLPLPHLMKNCAGDLILRKQNFIPRVKSYFMSFAEDFVDPFDTFEYLLEKEKDFESIYYFFFGRFEWDNPSYNIDEELDLLEKISSSQNCTIGVHLGLKSFNNYKRMESELNKATSLIPEICNARQHYLSMSIPETFRNMSEAGVKYDSTFAFRDKSGFRSGACRPFPLYDYERDVVLDTWERPLILMESQIIDQHDWSFQEKAEKIQSVKNKVKEYNGEFVFLWHNHRLVTNEERKLYELALNS